MKEKDRRSSDNTALKKTLLLYKEEANEDRLPQQAYIIIQKAIRNLQLQPDEAFLEREIIDMLEMSRTPVREALIRLEMDRWIRLTPRKGFSVEPIIKENIEQICQIAEALDGVAAELATLNIDEEHLGILDSLIALQEKHLNENNLKAYIDVDNQFHNLIVEYSQNERLQNIMDSHSDQLYRARLFTINERKLPVRSIKEHQAIVAAMRAQDSKAAQLLMHSHRHRGGQEILGIIESKPTNKKKK
ncbi:DNA-binding GntR family transcriptional regulator [Planomicrobium stackebrandtii]|uniref:DNA-binding GntR family transcriptional regulator n=1 Tax=Planomicrobium stackebrandtii TaxID=253160 RepID=A0ABU0GW65_9BACL|nr:GntR family transcriptional regulator [Planomicrobium stackebrandtii]MDQ0429611.1 DNA-binding GntR family transcriptional regulator [Planomicrobium stackebrandtii]